MFTSVKPLLLCLIVFLVLLMNRQVNANTPFHSGGSGDCGGCHQIHNSSATQNMNSNNSQTQGNSFLLIGTDQSSTCLNCHQKQGYTFPSGFHISTAQSDMPTGAPPVQMTPGGDFGWLKKTYSWSNGASGLNENSPGERHGHNIIAADFGYLQDSAHVNAPGGSYPSINLHCSSCHDPHGKYRRDFDGTISVSGTPIKSSGSYNNSSDPDVNYSVGVYRLLGGVGYTPKSLGSNAFVNGPPAAVAPDIYNRKESVTQTRVAYGRDMSEWCTNCHTEFISSSHIHPAGNDSKFGIAISSNYNAYKMSGDLAGSSGSSYSSLSPFEEGVTDHSITSYNQLKTHARSDDSFLEGPDNNSATVGCISCHRAHASGWDGIGRFNFKSTFITVANTDGDPIYPSPSTDPEIAMGRTAAEIQAAYYDRPAAKFSAYQRSLCNKCHAKD